MTGFINKFNLVIKDTILRKRIIFALVALAFTRVLAVIPVPGIDPIRLVQFFKGSQLFGLLDVFSGGGLAKLSIVMLGVGPYITASIIMQLLTVMSPKLKAMYQEEGEAGKKKVSQYSRLLGVPLAIIQAFSFIVLFQKQGIIGNFSTLEMIVNVLVISAGSVLLMWIGELITEFGVGNGVSLIIFAGIVARIPSTLSQVLVSFDVSQVPMYLGFLLVALVIIGGVVFVTEAERPIPVTYAKRVRGMKVYGGISTYIPLRLNQAGVIPIIFALSLLLFPQMILKFLSTSGNSIVQTVSSFGLDLLSNSWFYAGMYFLLVFIFTYFYTAVTFDPNSLATNLQKNGAFIPGVRPGQPTSEHIAKILTRLTFVGALFLGLIAVLPLVIKSFTGISSLAIGGTALLIVVSVVIDLMKKVDAQISLREY